MFVLVALLGAAGLGLATSSLLGREPPELGLDDAGRLRPCPATPNCVSSQAADAAQRLAPLAVAGPDPIARLRHAVEQLPRTRIVATTDGYVRAESRTLIFRYVDDLELALDAAAGVAQVRSASRVGRSDFGANRARVEQLRELLTSAAR